MKKNIASQSIGAEMITAADGTNFTGAVSVLYTIDNGTQTAGGGTAPAHEGNGYHSYTPLQAETNGDHVAFTFTGTGAITSTVQVYTSFPQTVDNNTVLSNFAFTVANQVDSNMIAISGDATAADNLESTYDGTGYVNDKAPATQEQVGGLSVGAGGISVVQDSFTATSVGTQTNTSADTEELNGVYHICPPTGGTLDARYNFNVGTGNASTEVVWDGYVQTNNDELQVFGYDYISASFKQVGLIDGLSGATEQEKAFILTSAMTDTNGDAIIQFYSTGGAVVTNLATDRILVEYTVVPSTVADIADGVWDEILTGATHNINNSSGKRLRGISGSILTDGTAQSGGNNSIQLASGDVSLNDQWVRAKVVITSGTGTGQEAIITESVASTDTLTVTPQWLVNPDNTSDYQVIPGQVHATVRNGGYDNGFVYIDVVNGSAGTVKGVNGTSTNKSSVLADARTLANNENIRKFLIEGGGTFSLDQSYANWIFEHVNASLITLNSQDVSGSVFMRSGITGTGTMTTRGVFELCGLANVSIGACNFLQCGFNGTTTLTSEAAYLAWDCFENQSVLTAPIIDMAGDGITATTLELVNYSGRVEIQNMTSVDVLVLSGQSQVTLNANCSGGTMYTSGDVKVTDNSTVSPTFMDGLIKDTVDDIAALNDLSAAQVNAELLDVLVTDTFAEVTTPSATASIKDMLHYVFSRARNKTTQTATTLTVRNDADSGNLGTSTVSDDGTTFTKGEES